MDAYLAQEFELLPRIRNTVRSRTVDPVRHLFEPSLNILAIAKRAAFAPQKQLVEQLNVHEPEELLVQRLHVARMLQR